MYDVLITETKKGKKITTLHNFYGKVTPEVQSQWDKIVKNSDFKIQILPYSNDKSKGKENADT